MSRKTHAGPAWLIIAEWHHTQEKMLISILCSRWSSSRVVQYMRQTYIDRYSTVNERISLKKGKDLPAFQLQCSDLANGSVTCGHEPSFRAIYCDKISQNENGLFYSYRMRKAGETTQSEEIDFHDSISSTAQTSDSAT